MRQEKRAARAEQIEDAAYRVLEEKGYAGMSMLAVARAAKASNETLYRWYGDKTGLFQALILRNTQIVQDALQDTPPGTALAKLAHVGPVLLAMLLGPRAVALNRAAAADGTGVLGRALAQSGRDTVRPWIAQIIGQASAEGTLALGDSGAMADTYFALLIGESSIRRVTGATAQPSDQWVAARAETALLCFEKLFAPGDLDAPRLTA